MKLVENLQSKMVFHLKEPSAIWHRSKGSIMIVIFIVSVLAALVVIATTDDKRDALRLHLIKNGITMLHNPLFKAVSDQITEKSRAAFGKETIGFVVSPLWVDMLMMLLSAGTSGKTLEDISRSTHYYNDSRGKYRAMKLLLDSLPPARHFLKMQSVTKMYVRHDLHFKEWFTTRAKNILNMDIEYISFENVTEATNTMNKWVEHHVLGKTQNLFDEAEFDPHVTTMVLINTLYFRSKWLYAPTVLNGTTEFATGNNSDVTTLKMFRINGMMLYADILEWDAVAVDVPYYSDDLSMLIVIPNKPYGLLEMEKKMLQVDNILEYVVSKMTKKQVAVTLPKFTLHMTVLLPSKLETMGMGGIFQKGPQLSRIAMDWVPKKEDMYISNAVQRLKIWAEEGRGAFKDDGYDGDPPPEKIVVADRPYCFMIRQKDLVIISGHFVV